MKTVVLYIHNVSDDYPAGDVADRVQEALDGVARDDPFYPFSESLVMVSQYPPKERLG